MKNSYLAIPFLFIFFVGCASTFRVSDFSSKEKFYDEFNSSFKRKEVKFTLLNDSSFTASDGAEIINDTLISYTNLEEKRKKIFALPEIAEVNFFGSDNQFVMILPKNGDEMRAESVEIGRDTINFVEIKNVIAATSTPIDKVKTASYKNRWRRVPLGAIAGIATGGILSLSIGSLLGEFDDKHAQVESIPSRMMDDHPLSPIEKAFAYWFSGSFLGLITGSIIGYSVGYTAIYQFNP